MAWLIIGLVLGLLAIGIGVWRGLYDGYISEGIAGWFIASLCGAVIWGLCALFMSYSVHVNQPWQETQTRNDLKALGSDSAIEGRSYFLGGGYVDEKRVLNYIIVQDDYSTLEQADADRSRIFEDESGKPYVIRFDYVRNDYSVVPWNVDTGLNFDFHIPPESVLESYSIDNG